MEGLLRLPDDVRMESIDSIVRDADSDLELRPGSVAVSRPRTRSSPQLITGSTLELIEGFRSPRTIVDAVIDYSRRHDESPEAVLEAAFPVLQTLIREGILVAEDSELSVPIDFLLDEGVRVDDYTILSAVSVIVDTEVYRAAAPTGGWVALKIARPGAHPRVEASLVHEAAVLALLDGAHCPRLLRSGRYDERGYIAMQWCDGVDIASAATLARGSERGRSELVSLALAVLDAFVCLHARGVVHGDIHPRNVLVDASGTVHIIDFGQAVLPAGATRSHGRGVVDLYMEPELARARLASTTPPAATPASDQYALAALLYVLLTGSPTHDFHLSPVRMLTQVRDEQPATFAARGVTGLDHTERALRRALEKDPVERFANLAEFARATRLALSIDGAAPGRAEARFARGPGTADLLRSFLARVDLDSPELDQPQPSPTASLNLGAAGTALALLTISQATADQQLLAAADAWAVRAATSEGDRAWHADDVGLSPDRVGEVSLHHAVPGVRLVSALVAQAQDDRPRRDAAIDAYVRSRHRTETRSEVGFGLAGLLIGCAMLVTTATNVDRRTQDLIGLGDDLEQRIARSVSGTLSEPRAVVGTAHGLAGQLTTLLRWREATGRPPDETLIHPLRSLANLGQPSGRGRSWPVSMNPSRTLAPMQPTWCNGSAGLVHLWLAADAAFGDEIFLEHATRAAWTTFESPRGAADLCCGSAGRAYALLAVYRRTNDERWLARAKDLAVHAAKHIGSTSLRRQSLYRGEAGVAVLVTGIDDPGRARMPAFEL